MSPPEREMAGPFNADVMARPEPGAKADVENEHDIRKIADRQHCDILMVCDYDETFR